MACAHPHSGERKTCNLFEKDAQHRASIIKQEIDYKIFLNLNKGELYDGLVHISFATASADGVFLDYCGDLVSKLLLNGNEIDPATAYASGKIHLPSEHIRVEGINLVEVSFANRYYNDGNGLHSFTDFDGSQYLYIQSEPFWNNRVLPMFDQPDLKGYFSLTTLIPKEWTLITSEDPSNSVDWEKAFQPINGLFHNKYFGEYKSKGLEPLNLKLVNFPKSKLLPTYLFFFAAGPYQFFELPESERFKNIPMKVYCRESLKQFIKLQTHQFFTHHKKGIELYERIFGLDYMFNKCDMVICPEYTIGAMEYPGSITYSEALFARGEPSIAEVTLAGRVGLHELSHMWFGDCVTSYWWNDTWLKESFADYIAYLASAECSPHFGFAVENSWINFLLRKLWGYDEDAKSTTHPIAAEVISTEVASGVFDGISYAKGAAVIKQLQYLVGLDRFSDALKVYFQRKAWKNARLDDLIEVFQEVLGGEKGTELDMIQWKNDWLCTAGTNIITVEKRGNNIAFLQGFVLKEHPTLRFHKLKVTLYAADGTVVESRDVVIRNQPETVVDFGDLSNVAAILANDGDYGFAKINLDAESTTFFQQNVHSIADELSKACIYKCFYDMLLDAKLKARAFADFISSGFSESNTSTLNKFLKSLLTRVFDGYLRDAEAREVQKQICHQAYEHFRLSHFKNEFSTFQFCLIMDYGYDEETIDRLKAFYDAARVGIIESKISITNKWGIIKKIAASPRYSEAEKQRYIQELEEADTSDTKTIAKAALEVLACKSDEDFDQLFLDSTKDILPYSYKVLQYKLKALNDYHFSEETRTKILIRYYQIIDKLTAGRTKSIAQSYLVYLFPASDNLEEISRLMKEALDRISPESRLATKLLTQKYESVLNIIQNRKLA